MINLFARACATELLNRVAGSAKPFNGEARESTQLSLAASLELSSGLSRRANFDLRPGRTRMN